MTTFDTSNQDLIKVVDKGDNHLNTKDHHSKNNSVSDNNEKNNAMFGLSY